MKAIVFDYNRTLYNPEKKALFSDTLDVLTFYKNKGYVLFLVAKGGFERKKQIQDLKLGSFFKKIIVNEEKTKNDFLECIQEAPCETEFYVVGDRIKKEITFGNECQMKTIWLKKGKFSNEEPSIVTERPTFVIESLKEIKNIV